MTSTEQKLKERVKELTCLYEVTSIIVNSGYDELTTSLEAIAYCLKRGWQFKDDAETKLSIGDYQVQTSGFDEHRVCLTCNVIVFNKVEGTISVGYPSPKYTMEDFLEEEQTLLKNVSLAVGNFIERKQIHDTEQETKRQLERNDRLHILGEITAGIAHELNTPLANILGFAELLMDGATDPQTKRDLQKIMDNAIFSREIVKKLMFFTCEMPDQMEPVDLIKVIEDVVRLMGPSLRAKELKIITAFEQDYLYIRANTVQLTQVFFNLIMNAAYYSPVQGEIKIELIGKTKTTVISIMDQGEGISPDIENKIFEPFYTTKPVGEGTGLGLSVVHGIIKSYKGSIAHKPNTPKGTIFTIEFPN
ncbi:HAMP domain-containing histidine kinase [Muricauda ruestringensis]|uniref:sensor histidine kinase n=1 Tax=Flagellimonas ruestringensis TaxID=111501 RepID=UPI001CD72F21|nr:HAMP domain-containing sensor histidine kinase [Allomuricauda ruestringensis]MCA0957598.1 HAMP domain-containing histidine kinase [Allomuricauda ruestringensis]